MIKNHSNINLKFLEDIEEEDKVFPNINIEDWRNKNTNLT
jgi:1,4-alpha-glucan branching enzyme